MAKLGIVTGLAFEADIARSTSTTAFEIEVLCLGPGAEHAREAAEALVAGGASALMSFGVAGALHPGLRSGDLIIARDVSTDESVYRCEPALADPLRSTMQAHRGRIYGTEHPVTSAEAKAELMIAVNALAVDMESHAIAAVARRTGLPLIVGRAIVDPADQVIPKAALAGAHAGGKLNIAGLMVGLLQRPGELPDVIRLAGQNRKARRALRHLALFGLPELVFG